MGKSGLRPFFGHGLRCRLQKARLLQPAPHHHRESASLLCLVNLAVLMGCAAGRPVVVSSPVGPQDQQLSRRGTQGHLIVYSATRVSSYAQSEYPVHTAYTIYSPSGKMVERMQNLAGSFNQYPENVALLPGMYRVKALAARSGYVIVPVTIEPGKTTVVDLDGTPAR